MAVLCFVFWKLDQRASFLVKHAEAALALEEADCLPAGARVFANEPAAAANVKGMWTFGKSLRFTFFAMGLIGICGAALSALRWTHVIDWERPDVEHSAQVVAAKPGCDHRQAMPAASNSRRPTGTSTPANNPGH